MKKTIVMAAGALALAGMLTGCAHNALVYTTGSFLNLGVDPNTGKTGVQYINGDQITAVEKDNVKLTVEMQNTLDNEGMQTTRISKIIYEIGDQTTGYDVDLAEVTAKK